MKKTILIYLIFLIPNFLFSQTLSYAIGIFDENGNGENIQQKRVTSNDYNGVCYSKIVIIGNYKNEEVEVKIGNSIGHFQNSIPIFNKQKIKIADELTFKHYTITKGYFEVKINGNILDTKVYVK